VSETLKVLSTATMPSQLAPAEPRRALWGLLDRKERWSLSWRGRLILALILASALLLVGALVLKGVYPFLATTHRVDADVLVVEGWIHEYAIRAAVEEFRSKSYQRVFTTGGPVEGTGGYINDYNTEASVGAELLIKNGLPLEAVAVVPSRVMNRDRTYGSAIALRNWFREQNLVVRSLNVLTEDVHARRSRLLFQEAFGKDIKVGIIASPNPDYDWRHWWRYSAGVKEVSSETIAYLYAKCLFSPSEPPPVPKAAASDSDTR
jgi:uncharacterized SAM-binding protein YcdF (DUF218 family)